MDLRVLNQIVRDEEASISREKNARKMALRALALGDICMAAACPIKAIRIWRRAAQRLLVMDYQWVDVPIYFEKCIPRHVARQVLRGASVNREQLKGRQ